MAGEREVALPGQGAGLSLPNENSSLTQGQIARRRTMTKRGLCQLQEAASQASCRNEAACWEAVHRPTYHTDWDWDTATPEWVRNRHMTDKSLRQRERKRYRLNWDQSIFSKCDLSSCLLFCHILEGLLLGLQGGEGIYLHQITFLYTSPHWPYHEGHPESGGRKSHRRRPRPSRVSAKKQENMKMEFSDSDFLDYSCILVSPPHPTPSHPTLLLLECEAIHNIPQSYPQPGLGRTGIWASSSFQESNLAKKGVKITGFYRYFSYN